MDGTNASINYSKCNKINKKSSVPKVPRLDFSKINQDENKEMYKDNDISKVGKYKAVSIQSKIIQLEMLDPQSFLLNKTYIINPIGFEESKIGRKDGKVIVGFDEKQCDIYIPYKNENDKTDFIIQYNENNNSYFVKGQRLSSTTFIKVNKEMQIKKNYILSIGESNLTVDKETNNIVLNFLEGPKSGQTFKFDVNESPFIIGKGQECNLRIDDPSLSRIHCKITYKDQELFINDGDGNKPTTNGTWLFIDEPFEIFDNLIFKNGDYLFKITIPKW